MKTAQDKYTINPYIAMGDYSRPKLTKHSLLWATTVAEKFWSFFFFYFCFVVPFYLPLNIANWLIL